MVAESAEHIHAAHPEDNFLTEPVSVWASILDIIHDIPKRQSLMT
jgi:hypothetical protein